MPAESRPGRADRSSRRSFLRGCGVALAGLGASTLVPASIRRAMAGAIPRRLMVIFLRGGNDGINTVIPHGDPDYNAVHRPTVYIPPTRAIDLGNGFASLHPALAPIMGAFEAGDLAIVHRVGHPELPRSHFDGQRAWEIGVPGTARFLEGWLARYLAHAAPDSSAPLPAIAVQPLPPLLLRGHGAFAHIDAGPGEARTARDAREWDPRDPDDPKRALFPVTDDPANPGFGEDAFPFFGALKICALALLEGGRAPCGARVATTECGGWDLHHAQGGPVGRHADLLARLAYGLRSLRIVLSGSAVDRRGYASIWEDTLVMTLSEFGRTTFENRSGGTDHAAASCLFLLGGRVSGGLYNADASSWPAGAMRDVEGRSLRERTDYRAVLWEVLRDHMATSAPVETLFPGFTPATIGAPSLGLIRTL